VVWAIVWLWWFRDDPARHPTVGPQELAELGEKPVTTAAASQDATGAHHNVPWLALFSKPQLWLVVAMYWFYVWGFIFFMFWLPKFLTQGRGMSDTAMGTCVALMFSMGFVGNVIGGWASDRLSRRYGLAVGRKLIGATCLALCG